MEQRVENRRGRDTQNSIRPGDKLLLSRAEAAAFLSISKRAVDYLIADGVLCTRRIADYIDKWITSGWLTTLQEPGNKRRIRISMNDLPC